MSGRPLSTIRPIARVAIRNDRRGNGRYRAARTGAGGPYLHQGIDLVAPAGAPVVSPIEGIVDIKRAYTDPAKGDYSIVSVTSGDRRYRFFYVSPHSHDGAVLVRDGDRIAAGQQIGVVQDIAKAYPPDRKNPSEMTNHVHFAISDGVTSDNKPNYVDPTPQVDEWMRS